MKVAALRAGALLSRLRRSPPAPSPRPPSGGGRAEGRGGCTPSSETDKEPGGRAAAKGLLITLPDIGEEAAAEGDEAASSPQLPVETLSSLSPSGCTTPTELNNSWSGINSYTTSLSTERSSIYSWRDDEFDKVNTQRVHQLFWEIDEMLFEGKVTSKTENLRAECADWVEQFPHIRVLGKQLLVPKDEGFQHFQSRNDTLVDTKCVPGLLECTGHTKELCISGSKLIPTVSPIHTSLHSSSNRISASDSAMYSFLEEEIYDEDGKIEEYLAFDNKELEDEIWEQKKMRLSEKRCKRGIPPVSPNACIKDAVASEVFDHIWSNVIGILEELIKKNWETSIPECDQQIENLKTVTAKLLHLPAIHITADAETIPLSRGSEAQSVSFGAYSVSSQVYRFSSNLCSDLSGVMTIQAKPLQQRHAAMAEKNQNEQEDKQHTSTSSTPNSAHARLGRISDNSVLSPSPALLASFRKVPRLPSLTSDHPCSEVPNMHNDEIRKGKKWVGSSLSSARVPATRNKLPPINSETVEQRVSVPRMQQSPHQERYTHSRVSSAVAGRAEQQPLRERTVPVDQFSRPNTTHTFRRDTTQKSLTPVDFANHRRTGQGFLITGSQNYSRSFQRNPPNSKKRFQIAL
ncbi:protein FAM149A isoform X1 [Molothrus ater]|uniref:protein FAM149A isoform X1 n=2 Tax=Molothrus ater TaxID=84834 RepID=UPI0023E8B816|nr:protein FAM149A isoform X1 [Molothrus ater]